MFCKECGKEIANDAKFCPNCGTVQDSVVGDNVAVNSAPEQNAVNQTPPTPPQKGMLYYKFVRYVALPYKTVLAIFTILALILMGVICATGISPYIIFVGNSSVIKGLLLLAYAVFYIAKAAVLMITREKLARFRWAATDWYIWGKSALLIADLIFTIIAMPELVIVKIVWIVLSAPVIVLEFFYFRKRKKYFVYC